MIEVLVAFAAGFAARPAVRWALRRRRQKQMRKAAGKFVEINWAAIERENERKRREDTHQRLLDQKRREDPDWP